MTKLIKKYLEPNEPIRKYTWRILPENLLKTYTDHYTGEKVKPGDYVIVDKNTGILQTNENNPNLFADMAAAGYMPGRFEVNAPGEVTVTAKANPNKPILLEATKTLPPLRRKPGLMEDNPEWQQWRQDQIAQDRQIAQERDRLRKNNAMVDHLFFTLPAVLTAAPIALYEGAAALPTALKFLTTNPAGQRLVESTLYGEGLNQVSKLLGYEDFGEVPYRMFEGKDYANLNQWAKLGLNMLNPGYLFNPMSNYLQNASINTTARLTEQAMKSVPTKVTTGDLAKEMNRLIRLYDKNKILESSNQYLTERAGNIVDPLIRKFVTPEGEKRLRLYSHTEANPREIVVKPQGENKFEVHIRTWDGDHVPANLTPYEKHKLFEALDKEIPEGGEILFPKSNPNYVGTRGTVAALKKLSRDPRYMEGDPGTLLYRDKNGEVQIFNGTSFIKKVTDNSNPKPLVLSEEEQLELKHRLFNIVINSVNKTQRQRAWKALFYISEGSPATGKNAALQKLLTDNYYTIELYIKTGDRSLLKALDKGYIGQVTKDILDANKRIGETKIRSYLDFAHRDDMTLVDLTLGVKDDKINVPEIYKLLEQSPGILSKEDRIPILEGEIVGSKKAITNEHVLGKLKETRVKGITPIVARNGTNGEKAINTINNETPIFKYALELHRISSLGKGVYNTGGMWNYVYSDPTTGKYKIIELDIFKHSDLDTKYRIGTEKGWKEELKNNLLKSAINTAEDTPVLIIGERQLTTNDILNQLNALEKDRIKILNRFKSGEITEIKRDKMITQIQKDIDKAYGIMSEIDPNYYIHNRVPLDTKSEALSGVIDIGEGIVRPIKESDKHYNATLEKITRGLKFNYKKVKKDHKVKLDEAVEAGDKLKFNLKEVESKISEGLGNWFEELWLKLFRPKNYTRAKGHQNENFFRRSLEDEEFEPMMNVLALYSSTPKPTALKKRRILKSGKLSLLNTKQKAKNTVYILEKYTPTTKNKYELLKMIQNDETLLPGLEIEKYRTDGKIDRAVIEAYEPRLKEYKLKFKDFLIDASNYMADPKMQAEYRGIAKRMKMYKRGNKLI